MSEKAALDMVEAAREKAAAERGFGGKLFMGKLDFQSIFPFPAQSPEDAKTGDELVARVRDFLESSLDPSRIDREGDIPEDVIAGLKDLGLFGMKIPREYGGLGLSQVNYNRVIHLVASHCASTAVLLSAHQSIGVPKPLVMFGTDDQKAKFLPRLAAGAISAFALTEPGVGSDPSNMTTTAKPVEDGKAYLINGEKLWISNGPIAEIMIVMARTPSGDGGAVSAFIVETDTPGFETVHRCRFMGLNGVQNGLLRFTNVRVPRENLLSKEGRGMKIALSTLNTGRLTLPAGSAAVAKQCLAMLRPWLNERKQWGKSIGRHDAVAERVAFLAANAYAIDAVSALSAAMADTGGDIRIEAAMAKLFTTEALWRIVDDTLQTRGGRGYETAESLKGRGEAPLPVERLVRDARINMIIEGTSDIMRLFIAREALDPHLEISGVKPSGGGGSPVKAARFYSLWYPGLYLPGIAGPAGQLPAPLGKHMKFAERQSRKLARTVFHSMLKYRRKLQDRQRILGRIVDIGTRLFAMSAVVSKVAADLAAGAGDNSPIELADIFCRMTRRQITALNRGISDNDDVLEYETALGVMEGRFSWLEKDIVRAWENPS